MSTAIPEGFVPNPALPPARLGRVSRRTLAALIEAVIPPSPRPEGVVDRIVTFICGFIPYFPPMNRLLFPVGLWLFEYGTRLFGFSLRRFSSLSAERRVAYLHAWQHSGMSLRRQLLKGLKAAVLMAYYDQPEVKAHIGYDPDPYVDRLVDARRASMAARGLPIVVEPHDTAGAGQSAPVPLSTPEADADDARAAGGSR
jgi:hypothetical protein